MRPASFLLLALAALVGCGMTTPAADPNAVDKERLQGVWVFERLDNGSPKESARMLKEAKEARIQFAADKLTITSPDGVETCSFTLDATRDPKLLTTTKAETATQHAQIRRWIYKFEDDTLVLAHRDDGIDAAPDDFRPRQGFAPGEPSVAVGWLRKAD